MSDTFQQSYMAAKELLQISGAKKGQLMVVGCSTSEIIGGTIGHSSAPEVGIEVANGILSACNEYGVYLCAQCCEHLNRAIILPSEAAGVYALDEVNVVPLPKAGGSFATAVYNTLPDAVAVEHIRAHMGLDVGFTLIGMHLKEVAVPVRLANDRIGLATVLAARTRPKFIGGSRAAYDDNKK